MDVKEAVKSAKSYVNDIFHEEGLLNLGLEEIEFDEHERAWNVTLGFSRRWNNPFNTIEQLTGTTNAPRTYRIVKVRDDDGRVLSVKLRPV